MEIVMPTDAALEAIIESKTSKNIFSKQVGPYRLSIIYRQCSAVEAYDHWYPESMVFLNGHIEYQGEGWSDFRCFHALDTEAKVLDFITPEDED